MQRWIVLAAALVILASAGGAYALFTYRRNKPDKIWVPLKLPEEHLKSAAKEIEPALRKPAVLGGVVKDLGLVAKFGVASEDAAVAELSKRLFVEVGQANPPSDPTPSLNIGVNGTRREHVLLQDISGRLMKDVFNIMGIKQPQPAPF